MNSALDIRKYHLMERLMNISDDAIIKKLEAVIYFENTSDLSSKEMMGRVNISEQQIEDGIVVTHSKAKERLGKWLK